MNDNAYDTRARQEAEEKARQDAENRRDFESRHMSHTKLYEVGRTEYENTRKQNGG